MSLETRPKVAPTDYVVPGPSTQLATTRRLVLAAVGIIAVLILPLVIYPPVAMDIAAWALFAISVDLLLGFGGLLSFGHAAFWGTSAYTTGYIAIHLGVPFPVAILIGAIVAMVLAVPIGMLSVRSSGIYFAMVTLAFAQMIFFITNQWSAVTGGENGLQGVPKNFFGVEAVQTDPLYFYYAAIGIIMIGALIAWRVIHSPFGRVLVGIRDNPSRVRALGYDVERYKLIAFVLSAGLAGIAGGVFAISHGFVSLQEVDWTTSGKVVLMTVLGGMGTLWGGAIGAAVIVLLEDYLASAGFEGIGLITGGIFIICVLLFRKGIWGTAEVAFARIRRGMRGSGRGRGRESIAAPDPITTHTSSRSDQP